MRFSELHIETRREMPARARTDGERFLVRAGYVDSTGALTALGSLAVARLQAAIKSDPKNLLWLGQPIAISAERTAIESASGDLDVLVCAGCGYADEVQSAGCRKAAPSWELPRPLERIATPDCHTIDALSAFLGVPQAKTAKALLYVHPVSEQLVLVLVRGDTQASEHKLRAVAGDIVAASADQIAHAGAVPGYTSPIGLTGVRVIVDDLIPLSPNLVAGANLYGFHLLNSNYGRDFSAETVADLALASEGDGCPRCGAPLRAATAYVISDSSGVGATSALLCLAEKHHDERGLVIPVHLGAFDVYLMHLPSRDALTAPVAEELYGELERNGTHVLYDDRAERAGVKFNDADLVGCPIRITVGEKHLSDRMVELKTRSSSTVEIIPLGAVSERIAYIMQMTDSQ